MWMSMNYQPEESMIEFQDRIFAQDRPILESQRPELLPLDLQAELHLRSDRTAIAYRRWLAELGLRTGAA
jgi:phenylpropionate dioxygenase-like ring-hydroxylating dioxygenase large terminal subunit